MRTRRTQVLHVAVQRVARRSLQCVLVQNRLQIIDRFIQRAFIEVALRQVPVESREMLLRIVVPMPRIAVVVLSLSSFPQVVLRPIDKPANVAEAVSVLKPIRSGSYGRNRPEQHAEGE